MMSAMTLPKVAKHETKKISIKRAPTQPHSHHHQSFEDHLAVEEPLEIRIHDEPVSITMRTPGDDFALAAGFLYSEGLVHNRDDVLRIAVQMARDGGLTLVGFLR